MRRFSTEKVEMKSIEKKFFVCACTYSNNINRKWFVKYKYPNYLTGTYQVKSYKGQINQYNTVVERFAEIERIKQLILNNEPLPNYQGACKLHIELPTKNFAALSKLFYEVLEHRKKSIDSKTYIDYKSKIKRLGKWMIDNNMVTIAIGKFTAEMVTNFLEHLLHNGCSNTTYNAYKTLFASLTNIVLKEKKLEIENVWKKIETLKEIRKPFLPYTAAIEDIIANELPKDIQHWIFMQLTYCGYIRGTEQQKMKLQNIDFYNKCIRLTETKNGKPKTVVLPDYLIEKMIDLGYDKLPTNYYLFSATGAPGLKKVGKNYFNRKWKFFREKHNIPIEYKSYGAKPTGMIKQRRNGRDTKEIQQQADHSSLDQTAEYLRTMDATHLESFRKSILPIGQQPIKKEDETVLLLRKILERIEIKI